jgi:uncharacterized protein (TIGR03435 family)
MRDSSDMELVRDYARLNSEAAFAELVQRHINLAYSAALRHVGNAAHAEEITQAVFIILARKAASLRPDCILEGWLHETTRLTALSFLRGERRRQFREQEAYMLSTLQETNDASTWNQLAPMLDEAVSRLAKKDRDAVMLRFFKDKNLREVAAALNVNEAAAQRRVLRAVEKLRRFFTNRGVALSSVAIAGAISANSIQAAPVTLANSVTAVAIAKGAAASGSTLTLIKGALKIMAWTKVKTTIVIGVIALTAASTTTVVVEKVISINQNEIIESIFRKSATSMASLDQRLKRCPPVLIVRPTHYPSDRGGSWIDHDKGFFVGGTMPLLLCWAYETLPDRVILPDNVSNWQKYDYLNNLPNNYQEALRTEIKKQFGLVAHTEMLNTNVLLLKIKDKSLLQSYRSRPSESGGFSVNFSGDAQIGSYHFRNMTVSDLARRLESYFGILVIGSDESPERYSLQLQLPSSWSTTDEIAPIIQEKLEQFGFEFIPTNMPVEMLVVKKVQ